MNHQPEHLSAGMDGELTGEELRFLLRRLEHDRSLLVRWERFHVASAGIRGELPSLASASFADRVMRAIGDETVMASGAGHRRSRWFRLSAGGAIAAGVAVVALMASRPTGPVVDASPGGASVAQASAPAATAPVPTPMPAPAAVPRWLSNSNPMRMTQMASYPQGDSISPYEQSISPYRVKATLPAADGSYLLLVDPRAIHQTARRPVREAASAQ
ncbi:MAG: sigma-E factor negative regulatory protein [Xanthomonadaceae bacterium]|nr:sigma-E factor negative regulatory protein [Xanthomonadaceae bacterium]MDE1963587.1 sigma-E factor negative regulatory protein [Xanthomonadaceae bacterium]